MERFRVKAAHKQWNDAGPDLLRKDKNAVKALRAVIGARTDRLFTRRKGADGVTEWVGPATKGEVMDQFTFWQARDAKRDEFHVGEGTPSKVTLVAQARSVDVPIVPLAHCTKATEELHSLVHFQFPDAIHSGGFLYRQIDGSTAWSDHAWGTAIDESQNTAKGLTNDEVFNWLCRMAQSGNIDPDYILGSRDGQVKQCSAPDYVVEDSSAATSHLWHCHVSQVDHDGRKPPRNPMVP